MHKSLIAAGIAATLLGSTISAAAHDGYHYAGLQGSGKNSYYGRARMRMPQRPSNCGSDCHVIGWVIMWDAYATGQYLEAGIGYSPGFSNTVMLWWATPDDSVMQVVGSVPFGTWVEVISRKDKTTNSAWAMWRWTDSQGVPREIKHTVALPGWTSGPGYHTTKAEVWTESGHPGNVMLDFEGIPTFVGDSYAWHVDGPWQPWNFWPYTQDLGQYGWFSVR